MDAVVGKDRGLETTAVGLDEDTGARALLLEGIDSRAEFAGQFGARAQ